jgi:hypothetical protein
MLVPREKSPYKTIVIDQEQVVALAERYGICLLARAA